MNWHPKAEQFLLNENYDQLVDFYENHVEANPENFSNYVYLGLAYLLQGQEEQAQITWFIAFEQIAEEDIDAQTQILVGILSQEAERQFATNNHKLAWLIRSHIKELSPNDFGNLLRLICLDIQTHDSDIGQFEAWKLGELCQSISADSLSTDLLLKAINIILCLPCPDSLAFARFCLGKTQDFDLIVATIVNLAVKIGYGYPAYAIDLLNICLEPQVNNPIIVDILPNIFNAIYVFSSELKDFENAIKIAYQFLVQSKNLEEKIFANYQIIYTYLKSNHWEKLFSIFEEQKDCLNQLIGNPEGIKINFIRQSLLLINQPLFYLQDNPQENRYFINNISKIFQSFFREDSRILLKPHTNILSYDRPLKIGYIAHTLKSHSVGWLTRWLIHYHNQDKYSCYIYAMKDYADEVTVEWFQKKVKGFYRFNQDIAGTIEQIHKDKIDILVDLDSFTLDLTCQVMALKPAPIQITWLGMDASGIPAIDYFIADPYVLPDNAQDYYSEKIWRLPHTYLGIDGFEVDIPNISRKDLDIPADGIIYLNVQNVLKRHPQTIHQQMKIIKAVPNSYFLIKGNGDQERLKHLFIGIAEAEGVSINRLRFLYQTPTEVIHRANLAIADVVLDTYPYNGATTTLETLWMEIPLVTRVGEQFAARNSYTFMMNTGITEGIAWSDEEYVEWGIKLGTDENLRKEVSWKLRQSKKTSPLWNGKQFTREMEKAYQEMWKIYVDGK